MYNNVSHADCEFFSKAKYCQNYNKDFFLRCRKSIYFGTVYLILKN